MKARMKVLASFEAALPWHVNITSLKHRSRFGEVVVVVVVVVVVKLYLNTENHQLIKLN